MRKENEGWLIMDEFIDLYCPTKIKDFVLLVC
jgi:hypothetical protein